MKFRRTGGAVAAGHSETVRAATETLEAGGNAFDAALAACAMACVAEPVLASIGGGGFALARPVGRKPVVIDFFVQTPLARQSGEETFFPVQADFGTTRQQFHIGLGTAATPGFVPGLFDMARRYASLPMADILAPAIRTARSGLTINPFQSYLFGVVSPIYRHDPASRACFGGSAEHGLLGCGEPFRNPRLADVLAQIAEDGEADARTGELAQKMANCARDNGGHLRPADFEAYQTRATVPLTTRFRDATVLTNPPPSSGGTLIAFALKLLDRASPGPVPVDLRLWARIMAETQRARLAKRLDLDDDHLAACVREMLGHPPATRGTTHVSVIDSTGNAIGITLTNGEGCGIMVPDCGFMLNNMLGEEDINPGGCDAWVENVRMSSMMAPTLIDQPGDRVTILGSGGSNRIRSALSLVIEKLTRDHLTLDAAIRAPRMHVEGRTLFAEVPDGMIFDESGILSDGAIDTCRQFDRPNMFFGGVHAVRWSAFENRTEAFGDPRRAGQSATVIAR